jgi:hypothetical protein
VALVMVACDTSNSAASSSRRGSLPASAYRPALSRARSLAANCSSAGTLLAPVDGHEVADLQ